MVGPHANADTAPYHPNVPSPTLSPSIPQVVQHPPGAPSAVAQHRAAQELEQRFGPRAAVQVSQLQQSSRQQEQTATPKAEEEGPEDKKPNLSAFSSSIPPARTPLQAAQQDGTSEASAACVWEEVRGKHKAAEASALGERPFHNLMLHRQQQIEAGGLLLPLEQNQQQQQNYHHHSLSTGSKRRADALLDQQNPSVPIIVANNVSTRRGSSSLRCAQADGQADEDNDEEDEDAINSDLDDPEDGGGHPEDDSVDEVMLCTYDKVQRTKNKWKCFLKDGILRVGNKEYVVSASTFFLRIPFRHRDVNKNFSR